MKWSVGTLRLGGGEEDGREARWLWRGDDGRAYLTSHLTSHVTGHTSRRTSLIIPAAGGVPVIKGHQAASFKCYFLSNPSFGGEL